jgi:hypothetical protein
MKKILAALALLALVFGTVAAQDGEVTVKGAVRAGVQVNAGNEYSEFVYNSGGRHEDGKAYVKAWSDDAGRAFQTQIQVDYNAENYGASIRFRVDERSVGAMGQGGLPETAFLPSVVGFTGGHAYGWFSFLNNIVEVSGGLLDNVKWGAFTTFYYGSRANFDNLSAVKLDIRPIEGLSFGVSTITMPVAEAELKNAFYGTVIGAKYVVPDTFGIAAEFALDIAKAATVNTLITGGRPGGDLGLYKTDFSTFAAQLSAFYYGVENLKIDIDGGFATNKDTEANSLGLALQANYQISEPLYAGIRAAFETMPAKEDNIAALEIRPQAGYVVNDWLDFNLEIPIGMVGGTKGLEDGTTLIGVKPQATFTISNNAKFVLFYKLGTEKVKDVDMGITNTVQLDFIWTF